MTTSIIVLDIDGVLNSKRSAVAFGNYHRLDPVCISLLNRVVRHTGASLLYNTTWLKHMPSLTLHETLIGQGMAERNLSATINCPEELKVGLDLSYPKPERALRWLHKAVKIGFTKWNDVIVFEDDPDPYYKVDEFHNRVVATNHDVGMTHWDAERAIELLGGVPLSLRTDPVKQKTG